MLHVNSFWYITAKQENTVSTLKIDIWLCFLADMAMRADSVREDQSPKIQTLTSVFRKLEEKASHPWSCSLPQDF
jgi:competence protein ComGF